jgi:uncharacterized repeat protein (TIGR04042 family)
MPEIRFKIEWPNGQQELCYSPSLVVKKYFTPGSDYELNDFVERSRTALHIASDRVKEKFGMPCGLALGQLAQIEAIAAQFSDRPDARVRLLEFVE